MKIYSLNNNKVLLNELIKTTVHLFIYHYIVLQFLFALYRIISFSGKANELTLSLPLSLSFSLMNG